MPKSEILSTNEKNLIRRYLVWCYKTTKEELDRIDRYYTQHKVDEALLRYLRQTKEAKLKGHEEYKKLIDDFEQYARKKKDTVDQKKYANLEGDSLAPRYFYLRNRFRAIEKAVIDFLGRRELNRICQLYEEEMTARILQAREHA